jgi:hypothetical protein
LGEEEKGGPAPWPTLPASSLFDLSFMKDREESALVQAKKQLQQFWQDTGVTCDERLLKAFRQLSREEFVSPIHRENAYMDYPLPIGSNQTISQPTTVMTKLALVAVTTLPCWVCWPSRWSHWNVEGSWLKWLLRIYVERAFRMWKSVIAMERLVFQSWRRLIGSLSPQRRLAFPMISGSNWLKEGSSWFRWEIHIPA